jgi:hypothetical protein
MKPSVRRSGRLHWVVFGLTLLLLALIAWREKRSVVQVILCAAAGLGLLYWALRPVPDATGGEEAAPASGTKPIEPPRAMGPARMLLFLIALAFVIYPLIDLALHLTPYRLVWSGAHELSPLRPHELVLVSTEFLALHRGQVAWLHNERAGGSGFSTLVAVGPDSVPTSRLAEAYEKDGRKSPPISVLSEFPRADSSWIVPEGWVAVAYARAEADSASVIVEPMNWVHAVGRQVLFPRITRLP